MALKSVSAPRFGGCQLTSQNPQSGSITKYITKCAFSPEDCDTDSQYVKPHEVKGGICDSPSQVSTGRCTSSLDKEICVHSATSCTMVSLFESQSDPQINCNLVQDEASADIGSSTKYPRCGYDDLRCVLSKEYACGGDEVFFPVGKPIWQPPCTCDEVPVGMCHITDVSPITTDSSFCAVGSWDCPDTYSFMPAEELLRFDDAPRACYLCRKIDFVRDSARHEHVVESGGCYSNGTNFLKCALQSTDCPPSTDSDTITFKTSIEMRELQHVPCTPDDITTGKCTSSLDQVDCTGDPTACYDPSQFEPNDSCTIHSDIENNEPTYFGRCKEALPNGAERCAWQKSECDPIREIWSYARLPSESWQEGCNCFHVETGGCAYQKQGEQETLYHCAVSKDGCTDSSSYLSSIEMKALGIHCKLCQPREVFVPTPHPTSKGHGEIMGNLNSSAPSLSISSSPSSSDSPSYTAIDKINSGDISLPSNEQKKGNVPLILVITCVLITIIFVVGIMIRRQRKSRQQEQNGMPSRNHSLTFS